MLLLLQLTLKGRLGEKITSSRSSDDTTRKVHRYSIHWNFSLYKDTPELRTPL